MKPVHTFDIDTSDKTPIKIKNLIANLLLYQDELNLCVKDKKLKKFVFGD